MMKDYDFTPQYHQHLPHRGAYMLLSSISLKSEKWQNLYYHLHRLTPFANLWYVSVYRALQRRFVLTQSAVFIRISHVVSVYLRGKDA